MQHGRVAILSFEPPEAVVNAVRYTMYGSRSPVAVIQIRASLEVPIRRAQPVKYQGQLVARAEQVPRAIPVNPQQINEARDWISNADPSPEQPLIIRPPLL